MDFKFPSLRAYAKLIACKNAMVEMKKTIDGLREAGLREKVKVFVGGAP